MGSDTSNPPIKIALVTVGTANGTSVLYSRSKRSIHQHAKRVSLRKAETQASALSTQLERQWMECPPRANLMTRFRVRDKPAHGQNFKSVVNYELETTSKSGENSTPLPHVRWTISLTQQSPLRELPFETGVASGFFSNLCQSWPLTPSLFADPQV